MPPTTRRSQASAQSVPKKITRKRATQSTTTRKDSNSFSFRDTRNDSDNAVPSTEVHIDGDADDIDADNEQAGGLALDGPADVQTAVNPLREMADKVGREVEQFAALLDGWLKKLPEREDKHVAAIEVADHFKAVAELSAKKLQERHDKERLVQLRKEWASHADVPDQSSEAGKGLRGSGMSNLTGRKEEDVRELRHWQQEADIWELFKLVLNLYYRQDMETLVRERQTVREDKLAQMEYPNRFTSEAQLYERFLVESDRARGRSLVKRWLEETADHQETDIPGIMEELEARSGAGKGLWSKGWLHTRERIKQEKRLRTWPSPEESVLPQIRTREGEDMLVTTLDPDAALRQNRVLEKEDRFYERAVWVACWEMLRRGKSWTEIADWCAARNEGWRAAALFGVENQVATSNGAWRKMCYLASESDCSNVYEAAVYGLLSGNAKAVERVCKSFDDHLFAYYSTTLTRHFEHYLQQNYPSRMPAVAARRGPLDESFDDEEKSQEAFNALANRLRNGAATKDEALMPLKVIESYLLNNDAENLIYTTGMAASDLDSMGGGAVTTIERFRQPPAQLIAESNIILDPHALRIAAHIYAVIRAIDPGEPRPETVGCEENVLISYIQALRARGARDYAPMYASRLKRERAEVVMSSVLQDVSDGTEQTELLHNMTMFYKMDVVAVCTDMVTTVVGGHFGTVGGGSRPLEIVEKCEAQRLYPGRRIRGDFMAFDFTDEDDLLARSLEWFTLMQGEWKKTFGCLGLAMRKALVSGKFSGALKLAHKFPFGTISVTKSKETLGKAVNVMDETSPLAPAPGTEESVRWDLMRRQSKTYYELEQLVNAIQSLFEWVSIERAYTSNPHIAKTPPSDLKAAKADLDESMQPLLQPGFLADAADDLEAGDLRWIRLCYLPEVIIAYGTALYTAGPTISRDAYIQLMDLSTVIADEATSLYTSFVESGRMTELVETFAQASKMMLVLKTVGGKRKVEREGKELGLWEIGGGSNGGVMAGLGDTERE